VCGLLPAGVYETIDGEVRPGQSSNCLHCKTCQRQVPLITSAGTVPEGGASVQEACRATGAGLRDGPAFCVKERDS